MNPEAFATDIFQKIQMLDREGNLNGVIAETVAHYHRLGFVRPDLLEKIVYYSVRHPHLLSPESIEALKTLPFEDLKRSGLSAALKTLPFDPPSMQAGRLCFPVVAFTGTVREIRVSHSEGTVLSPHRLEMLDQAGSPVFRVLRNRRCRSFLWRPETWQYVVLNSYEEEDRSVAGHSLELPLALALYSYMTQTPVPPDLSATGRVMRDGAVRPIAQLKKKLQALKQERGFVKRVLVSAQQEDTALLSGIERIKVATIEEAIAAAFPADCPSRDVPAEIDLKEELRAIEKQYDLYLIDACMENAKALIAHVRSARSQIPDDMAVPALFACHWRLGSCCCHRGDVGGTRNNLQKADTLFRRSPGLIRQNDYWDSRIHFAVLLKDVFRYPQAEELHTQIQEKLEQIGGLDHEKGKNLSSLSQLYLAQGRFLDAEALQKQAIGLIRKRERARNHGYLAQIYTRAGRFRQAKYSLQRAEKQLHTSAFGMEPNPFYDWIFAEYLYRSGKALKGSRKSHGAKWMHLLSRNPEVVWYAPALIHKFAGLAEMADGDEERGLQRLDRVIRFFDDRRHPVLKLLGVSVRVERALFCSRKGRPENMAEDLRRIREDLSMQKDIQRFFRKERRGITEYLRLKNPGKGGTARMEEALISLQKQIPY